VSDEEDEQFPKLREHIPTEQLREMGEKVEKAKHMAQTRPHPNAPHSQLYHKNVGTGAGMVDRLRDKLTRRHTDQRRCLSKYLLQLGLPLNGYRCFTET